jgi:hypothetical protein
MNDKMAKVRAELVLWRRFGHGFWFQVRSTSPAKEKRSSNLFRTLNAERANDFVARRV